MIIPNTKTTLNGWINLRAPAMATSAMARSEAGSRLRLEAHCLCVEFDPARLDRHIDTNTITLCTGTARNEAGEWVSAKTLATTAADADALARLRGHFSLVHIDVGTRTVTLVTDRFGIHPLVWALHEGKLWFSDRADAVAAACGAPLSPQALYDYVYFHVIPAPRTIFEGVHRLEPSRQLRADAQGSHESVLWSPHFSATAEQPLPELEKKFRAVLAQSIERELSNSSEPFKSFEPFGAFLSGGTDSSTVAGMVSKVSGKKVSTFSIGFSQEGYDEMSYARIAARHFNTDHHEYYVTADDLLQNIAHVAAHYDQPFGNSSALPAYCCAQMARAHGVSKIWAGDGGDELFGGNTRYAKQKIFGLYEHLPHALRARVLEPLLTGDSRAKQVPLLRKLASYVEQARTPMPDRMQTYNLLQRFGTTQVFTPALLSQVDMQAPLALQRSVYNSVMDRALVNRMLAYDWRFTLADTDLVKVTGTTALAGLDVSFPLLSDALVDFSLALPASMKVRGLTLRWFFKHALRDFLPEEILRKKKHGFGLPFGPWLTQHDDLRRFARSALDQLVARNLIRAEWVNDLFSSRLSEHAGYYGEMVWVLMMLEHWLAAHAPDFVLQPSAATP